MDTLKDAIRLKKGASLCSPKGGIRGDHVLLLTPAQINRLDKAQVEGRREQIRLSARQVVKNLSYTGGFIMPLARALPFVARALPTVYLRYLLPTVLTTYGTYINMINAIEYRKLKTIVSI